MLRKKDTICPKQRKSVIRSRIFWYWLTCRSQAEVVSYQLSSLVLCCSNCVCYRPTTPMIELIFWKVIHPLLLRWFQPYHSLVHRVQWRYAWSILWGCSFPLVHWHFRPLTLQWQDKLLTYVLCRQQGAIHEQHAFSFSMLSLMWPVLGGIAIRYSRLQ